MADEPGGEKVHPASPQKKQRAREEGNIARSQDLSSAAGLSVGLLVLMLLGRMSLDRLIEAARFFLAGQSAQPWNGPAFQTLMMQGLYFWAWAALPFMVVLLVTGLATNLAQVGFMFTAKPLQPKFSRLNPISGLKRFVSMRSLVELIKSLSKLGIIGFIVWLSIRSRLPDLLLLMGLSPQTLLPVIAGLIMVVWWRVALAMVVIGLLDLAFQRWHHEKDLRMTHQEVKQESKELEGDPLIKRRVRQLQRQMAMQRMMGEVPTADVIITNPTEYAVALRYDMEHMTAPVVVAKGMRLIAERIRDLGVEHSVPIVQKPELARTLYRNIDIGQSIPEDLFQAVAEVLSFVYRIDRRAGKIRERQAMMRPAQRAG